jgi:hypothetical protein
MVETEVFSLLSKGSYDDDAKKLAEATLDATSLMVRTQDALDEDRIGDLRLDSCTSRRRGWGKTDGHDMEGEVAQSSYERK